MLDIHPDTMRARRSVRSYDGEAIVAELAKALLSAGEAASQGPFGGRTRFALVERKERGRVRMGTYGLISNVPAYIAGAIARGPMANEDFGYAMEGLVLEATRLGLGSCWIGGLFDRARAAEATAAGPQDLVPAIVAVGFASDSRSLADRLIARVSSERGRKDSALLFFDADTGSARSMDPADPWTAVLEALRIAPSASNKQPWRIVSQGGSGSRALRFHLFLDEDPVYNRVMGDVKLQNVDMGIGIRHVEAAARHAGLPGAWRLLDQAEADAALARVPALSAASRSGLRYVASWTA